MCGSGHRNLSPGAGPDWTDRSIFRKKPWRTGPPVRPPAGGRRPSSCRKRRFCAVFRPCRRRPHSPFLAPSRCKNGYKTSRQRNIISCISSRIGLRLSGTARGTAPGMAPKAGDVSQCVGKCHVLSWSDSLRPLHPHRSYRPERSDGPRSGDIFPVQRPGPKHRAGKISPLRLCSGQAATPRTKSGASVEMTDGVQALPPNCVRNYDLFSKKLFFSLTTPFIDPIFLLSTPPVRLRFRRHHRPG